MMPFRTLSRRDRVYLATLSVLAILLLPIMAVQLAALFTPVPAVLTIVANLLGVAISTALAAMTCLRVFGRQ